MSNRTRRQFFEDSMFAGSITVTATSSILTAALFPRVAPGDVSQSQQAALLTECEQFRVVGEVIVVGGTGKIAFRAFPTMANLGNGELLVAYYLGRDHH